MPVINISYSSSERPNFDPRALAVLGPRISVDLMPPLIVEKWLQSRKQPSKIQTNVPALIDTGASVTGVDNSLLNNLGYPPIGVTALTTPSGATRTNIFMIRLVIPSKDDPKFPPNMPRIVIDNIKAVGVQLAKQPYKILLGRDVLSRLILVYNGPQALITLGY